MSYGEQRKERFKYRWEFMRRDPKYIQAYQEHSKRFLAVKRDEITQDEYQLEESKSAWEFGVRYLRSPARTFDELWPQEKSDDFLDFWEHEYFGAPGAFKWSTSWEHKYRPGENTLIPGWKPSLEPIMQIEIHFDHVNSIEALKREVLDTITSQWAEYKERSEHTVQKKQDYELFLKVGDLKEQGMTNQEIAKKVFPEDFDNENENREPNPESAIRKVSNYYAKYKELRDGGYKKLMYP